MPKSVCSLSDLRLSSRVRRSIGPTRIVFGLALLFMSGAAKAETLQDALAEAYYGNPQILQERSKLRSVDEGVPQALSGWRPTVQFTGTTGRQHNDNGDANVGSSFTDNYNSYEAKLSQPIFQGGGTVAQTAAAEASISAERATNVAQEGNVLLAVATYYFDVLRDTAVVAIDKDNEKALRDMLTAYNGRWNLGELTRTDVVQTEARAEAATAQRQSDEGVLQNSRENYGHYVGHLPGALTDPSLHPEIPASRDQAVKRASTDNPTVISDTFAEIAAEHTVDVQRAKLLPSLNVVADGSRSNGQTLPGITTTSASIIAQLTVPLYEAGDNWSLTRQAMEDVGTAKSKTDEARKAATGSAAQAWDTIQAARNSIKSLEAAVKADELSVEGVQREQLVGTRTITDVLVAEQQLFTDRVTLARTQHDMRVAEFTVAMQNGRLTALDLALKVDLYDVRVHYDSVRNKWFGLKSSDK